ncbi:MAG: hypothetical protein HY055_03525 [Magnetospirillum sp.]|nr:hypothetical protein [Magnetospirillum sp.]
MARSVYETIFSAVSAARRAGLDCADQRMAARVVLLANNSELSPDIARTLVDKLYPDIFLSDGRSPQLPW